MKTTITQADDYSPQMLQEVGELVEGIKGQSSYTWKLDNALNKTFVELIKAKWDGLPPMPEHQNSYTLTKVILAGLEKGETTEGVARELMILYRPSVQPYLVSWFRQAPAEAVAALAVPVLVVQGTVDAQVAVSEAQALKAVARRGELFLVTEMTHALKRATPEPGSAMKGLTDPTVPIVPELAPRIAAFLRAAAR